MPVSKLIKMDKSKCDIMEGEINKLPTNLTISELEEILEALGDITNCLDELHKHPSSVNENWNIQGEIDSAIEVHKRFKKIALEILKKHSEDKNIDISGVFDKNKKATP